MRMHVIKIECELGSMLWWMNWNLVLGIQYFSLEPQAEHSSSIEIEQEPMINKPGYESFQNSTGNDQRYLELRRIETESWFF